MRSKLKIITLAFVLFTIILVPSCYATTVLEDTNDYAEGAIIYGSTRFDMDQIITAGVAFNAGINESKVWVALGNKLNELEPVTPYYYDGVTWYEITNDSAEEIEDESEIKKIEENLHIFFVNNEVKTVEVPYEGNVDVESITAGVEYDSGDKKFKVPAYVFDFEFTTEDGAEVEVKTNIDTNIKEGNTEEVKVPEIIDNNIAVIGTVFYTDIYAALEAVKMGETVKLLKDIELSKQLVVTKEIVLDFNGKTMTVAKDLADISAILVLEGGDLVITGDGTLNAASQGNNYSIAVWAKETGKVTIKNGTFTNVGAKSKTETGANNNEMIYVSGSGVITIEGGTFIGNTENETWGTHYTLNSHDTSYKAGTANIIVKGGTYTTFNPANNEAEGPNTNFVVEGYRSVYDEVTNTYTVKAYDINNVDDDDSLKYALANAKEGDTINLAAGNYSQVLMDSRKKVAKNITLVGTEGVNVAGVNMNGANYGFVPEGLTLKNITFTDDVKVNNTDSRNGICKNLSIIECTFSNAAFTAGNDSTIDGLTIKDNKFNGTNTTNKTSILLQGEHTNVLVKGNIIDGSLHNAVQCTGVSGKITIDGNTIKNTGSRAMRITTATGAELTISNNIISNVNINPTEAEENNGEVIKITGIVTTPTTESNTYNGETLSFVNGIATIPVVE